ncbi:MAG: macro domain-containing protein [Bacilli bacterium]|nr:macro domain-containing protein [Bacilli bacterium]
MSKIELINGSSIEQKVDAIVNAANKHLYPGGGVCGAIFNKAGYNELTDACSKIKTPLNDGDAVITPAFNISNAKYIIHAVGSNFSITPNAFDSLFNAYYNSLVLLRNNNIHSISFPLISSGIYGGSLDNPVRVSTEQCIKAYEEFTKKYDYEIKVLLCAFTKDEMFFAKEVFK